MNGDVLILSNFHCGGYVIQVLVAFIVFLKRSKAYEQ